MTPEPAMKIQILVDGRIVSTQSDVDSRKLGVEAIKRRVLNDRLAVTVGEYLV